VKYSELEKHALVGYYAAISGNFLLMFQITF